VSSAEADLGRQKFIELRGVETALTKPQRLIIKFRQLSLGKRTAADSS